MIRTASISAPTKIRIAGEYANSRNPSNSADGLLTIGYASQLSQTLTAAYASLNAGPER
jgi:hypothetical protein